MFPLLAVTSFFLLYFLGLGSWVKLVLSEVRGVKLIALGFVAGILVNYFLCLALPSLTYAMSAGVLLALVSMTMLLVRYKGKLVHEIKLEHLAVMFMLPCFAYFISRIIFIPISLWDARLIWFFHAKIIYLGDTINLPTVFSNPFISEWSHTEYPKILPALAAQYGKVAGFWNEYLPRMGLLTLFAPAVFGITTFLRNRPSSYFLLLATIFGFKAFWGSGYMDGYWAIYAGLMALALCRWIATKERFYLFFAIVAAGAALGMKNEGMLGILLITIGFIPYLFTGGRLSEFIRQYKGVLLFAFVALAGFAVWNYYKMTWQLENDLKIGVPYLLRAFENLKDISIVSQILKGTVITSKLYYWLILPPILLVAALIKKRKIGNIIWLPILCGLGYFIVIFVIYLGTPRELEWHLRTSVDRTIVFVRMILIVVSFLLFQTFEDKDNHA